MSKLIPRPARHAPVSPGEMLREEFMVPLNLTQRALAERLQVPVGRINQILQGKRIVTADTAVRLSRVLGMSPEFWLSLQTDWDLWHALRHAPKGLKRIQATRRVA